MTPAQRAQKFYQRTKIRSLHGCWEYPAAQVMDDTGRLISVGRYSYRIHRGAVARHLFVTHLCKNSTCVNPAHLDLTPSTVTHARAASGALKTGYKGRGLRPMTPRILRDVELP